MTNELEDKLTIALANVEASKKIIENKIQQNEDYKLIKYRLQLIDIKIKLKHITTKIQKMEYEKK